MFMLSVRSNSWKMPSFGVLLDQFLLLLRYHSEVTLHECQLLSCWQKWSHTWAQSRTHSLVFLFLLSHNSISLAIFLLFHFCTKLTSYFTTLSILCLSKWRLRQRSSLRIEMAKVHSAWKKSSPWMIAVCSSYSWTKNGKGAARRRSLLVT
jgi:hypothetical protein